MPDQLTECAREAAEEIAKIVDANFLVVHEPIENATVGRMSDHFATIIAKHFTPEPSTSVIRWHRYSEGQPDDRSRQYIRSVAGIAMTWVPNGEVPENCWKDDDLWAYLPEPPEVAP